MAAYGYEALNSAGKEIKGSVEADNIEAARQVLKKQGIQVISIKPQSALTKDINIKVGGYPKPRDMSVFCRQFVSMTKAGVTISEALKSGCCFGTYGYAVRKISQDIGYGKKSHDLSCGGMYRSFGSGCCYAGSGYSQLRNYV